jgi:uncharacterized membrane protein YdbT with pleckstrin-like domain
VIAACLIVLPPIRHRVFWYAISPTEIDIQNGIVFTKRSIVPMRRVQTLRFERGPVADHYRMTTLKILTAAGSVSLVRQPHFVMRSAVGVGPGGGTIARGPGGGVSRCPIADDVLRAGGGG